MQAKLCPDCLNPFLEVVLKKDERYKCSICGWSGSLAGRPEVFVSPEMEQAMRKKLALKKAGRLFNVRVWIKTLTEGGADKLIRELASLFGSEDYAVDGEGKERVLRIESEGKPTPLFIQKVKGVHGVMNVEVF